MATRAGWFVVLSLVLGCGSTSVTVTPFTWGVGARTPKRPSQVEMFTTLPPNRRYVEVALLEADQANGLNEQGTELMFARMRDEAGPLGCDAIVIKGFGERAPAPDVDDFPSFDLGSHKIYGACIVYTEPETPVAAHVAARAR